MVQWSRPLPPRTSVSSITKAKAVVFEHSQDLALRMDDPNLEVTADSVLVLEGIGPIKNPGMPEAGIIPIPRE